MQQDNSITYDEQEHVMVDHFNQDTEAYASGLHARYVRSRSATPLGEDEDVHISDYESFDSSDIASQDKEKAYTTEPFYRSHAEYLQARYGKTPKLGNQDAPQDTQHYGPAPIGRVHRRNKVKKRVKLTRGNLVIDIDVPTKLVLPLVGEDEMMKTRYTAVTCDPDDFEKKNFFLRQNEYDRRTEMFIVITMYNVSCAMNPDGYTFDAFAKQEDEILFCRTLHGVMRNISHLCTRKNSQTWGRDAWKKVWFNRYLISMCRISTQSR